MGSAAPAFGHHSQWHMIHPLPPPLSFVGAVAVAPTQAIAHHSLWHVEHVAGRHHKILADERVDVVDAANANPPTGDRARAATGGERGGGASACMALHCDARIHDAVACAACHPTADGSHRVGSNTTDHKTLRACVGVRRRAWACVGVRRCASACVGMRRRASASAKWTYEYWVHPWIFSLASSCSKHRSESVRFASAEYVAEAISWRGTHARHCLEPTSCQTRTS